jgi:acyl-CoA hydrolase
MMQPVHFDESEGVRREWRMTNYKLVMPEHLNHYGFLFGGNLLKWVDEFAWMAASLDYPGCQLVTIAMDAVTFKKGARDGSILRFEIERTREGHTSATYHVTVFRRTLHEMIEDEIFGTAITFVRVGAGGIKLPLRDTVDF